MKFEKILEGLGGFQSYAKDEFLFLEQDKAEGFFIIRSGQVRVFKMGEQGREIEVVRLGPGDVFGEAVAFVRGNFPAYAQAVEDTNVLFVSMEAIYQKIKEDPRLAVFFLELMARKCITLSQRIETLSLRTVRQRLAQYLLSRCGGEKTRVVRLESKKTELAKILGTIPETLSRTLKQFQEEGTIRVEDKDIAVLDCMKLKSELFS